MFFLLLFVVGLVPALVGKAFFKGVTWKEFYLHAGAQLLIAGMSCLIVYHRDVTDVEILNGVVTSKKQVQTSCSHSYDCNCRQRCTWRTTGTGKNSRQYLDCRRVCDTCYEHPYDYDWRVYGSTRMTWTIPRVDSQGVLVPKAWEAVVVGEPTAQEHAYENFIKGSPDTLFKRQGLTEKYLKDLPPYPSQVYNRWHLDRFVQVGVSVTVTDAKLWNEELEVVNGRTGSRSRVNLIVVVTDKPMDYYFALEQHWVGGKKNDSVLVVGVDRDFNITWVKSMAWTIKRDYEVELEDEVIKLGKLDREKVLAVFEDVTRRLYKRKPMQDFEYLQASVVPTTSEVIVTVLLSLLTSLGLMILLHKVDVFGDERSQRWSRL